MASEENALVLGDIGGIGRELLAAPLGVASNAPPSSLGVASNAPPVFSRVNDWRTISAVFVGKRK
jgi:hypothetical protein